MQQILEPLSSLIERLIFPLSKESNLIRQTHCLARWEEFGKKGPSELIPCSDQTQGQ